MQHDNETNNEKLVCRNVWKLFGNHAQQFLRDFNNKSPSHNEITEAGFIGAVQSCNLEVNDGEIFVIMGLSGSGKSTLLRLLSRLIEPTAGQIFFNGEDLAALSKKRMIEIRRHSMGMVFQQFALLPHLSVLGNVAFPLEVQGIARVEREKRALAMIELVGLQGRESYYPAELSGGQQQRVGIARSLAVEPDLWFLDEPFSALDPLIRREMQDEFLRLQKLLNKTIVFVTHDFDEAIRLGDRIAIMKDGRIDQIGNAEQLILDPATDYVSEFTKNIPREKVLTLRSIMQPIDTTMEFGESFSADTKVSQISQVLYESSQAVKVINQIGEPIGMVDRESVIKVLMSGEA